MLDSALGLRTDDDERACEVAPWNRFRLVCWWPGWIYIGAALYVIAISLAVGIATYGFLERATR